MPSRSRLPSGTSALRIQVPLGKRDLTWRWRAIPLPLGTRLNGWEAAKITHFHCK